MRVIFGSFYNKFPSLEIEVSERIIRFQLHMPHGTVADDTEYFGAHQKHTNTHRRNILSYDVPAAIGRGKCDLCLDSHSKHRKAKLSKAGQS